MRADHCATANEQANNDHQQGQRHSLCRVRTITAFISLPAEQAKWRACLEEAKQQCDSLANAFRQSGYTVQSLRLVTNPFSQYLDTSTAATAKAGLAVITQHLTDLNQDSDLRIRFAIGEAQNEHDLTILPEMIKDYGDLCNACVNIDINEFGILDDQLIKQSVKAVEQIAKITPKGQGNFNFTINFNCRAYIPYFPASYHRGERGNVMVLGLETPDLLVHALEQNQNHAKAQQSADLSYEAGMQSAYSAMRSALQSEVDTVMAIAQGVSLTTGWQVIGLDTSAAPSKDCASMVTIYRLLGVAYFGASGTVEVSSLLTRVFKSIAFQDKELSQLGFSGLMLALSEDTGLAEASKRGEFDIRSLMTYSSVCGIGLDTVPIAGDTPSDKICALMRDTGTMAYRLNKPLTVRLFPVPNLQTGDMTEFDSDDLCNSRILLVP